MEMEHVVLRHIGFLPRSTAWKGQTEGGDIRASDIIVGGTFSLRQPGFPHWITREQYGAMERNARAISNLKTLGVANRNARGQGFGARGQVLSPLSQALDDYIYAEDLQSRRALPLSQKEGKRSSKDKNDEGSTITSSHFFKEHEDPISRHPPLQTMQFITMEIYRKEPKTHPVRRSRKMWRKEALALLVIAGALLTGGQVNAQVGNKSGKLLGHPPICTVLKLCLAIPEYPCINNALDAANTCASVIGASDLNSLLANGLSNDTVCSYSILQYACAEVSLASASTIASILKCYITNPDAVMTQGATSLLISKISQDTLKSALDLINGEISISSITPNAQKTVLNAVWENLSSNSSALSPGFLASWFQERLYPWIPGMNTGILNCLLSLPLTCDGYQAVIESLDVGYAKFDDRTIQLIASWITRTLQVHSCKKATASDSIVTYYRRFKSNVNFSDFVTAFPTLDLSTALPVFSAFQVAQYTIETDAFSSVSKASAVIELIEKSDLLYTVAFLDGFSQVSLPTASYDHDVLYTLLATTLVTLQNEEESICKPRLKDLFQSKLQFLLTSINETVIALFPANMDCTDFQDIFGGVDKVYGQLSEENQRAVFDFRFNYLKNEAQKAAARFGASREKVELETWSNDCRTLGCTGRGIISRKMDVFLLLCRSTGSGCTYGLQSSEWLQISFGDSIRYLSYSEIISLNRYFDGYAALSLFNINQTIDLIITVQFLTTEDSQAWQGQVHFLISEFRVRGFVYLQEFLVEFHKILVQYNVIIRRNADVRCIYLNGFWEILVSNFPQFSPNDWYNFFNQYLPVFLPCINPTQLSGLSITVVKDCSNFQTIVQGLNLEFDYISTQTKNDIASWISGFLQNTTCPSSDWLQVNYRQFIEVVSISTILTLNSEIDVIANLEQFTASQIGEIVILEESARTDVTIIEKVFDSLTLNITQEQAVVNIGYFWDTFNVEYSKVSSINISSEVQYTMLERTTTELEYKYESFAEADYTVWFQERLQNVITQSDTSILEKLPLSMDCSSYKAVVTAFNNKFTETAGSNRKDVSGFFGNYLKGDTGSKCVNSSKDLVTKYLRKYTELSSYETIRNLYEGFDITEEGVFQSLTQTQIGDALVVSNIAQDQQKTTQLFEYLKTRTVEEVNTCFTQFTKTAIEKNYVIEDSTVGTYILENYLTIVENEIRTFTEVELKLLFETRITILIKYFTLRTLSLLAIRSCNSLTIVVGQLNNGFDTISEETRQLIANWILSLLQQTHFGGCQNPSQSQWISELFGKFFQNVRLQNITAVYPTFDTLSAVSNLSISQRTEYIVRSDTLVKLEKTETILQSLKGADGVISTSTLLEFLTSFNVEYEQLSTQTMSVEVRETIMTTLFTAWTISFKYLTEVHISNFEALFKNVITGTTVPIVELISLDMNCNQFKVTFTAFSNVFNLLSNSVRQALFERIIAYLKYQSTLTTGPVCSTLYTDSRSYVTYIFYRFTYYATVDVLYSYNSKFIVYEVLDLFTGTQLGNLLVSSSAIRDQFKAVQILVEVQKRDVQEVKSFAKECSRVAKEKNLVSFPDENIQSLTFQTIWRAVSTTLVTAEDYTEWLGSDLTIFLSSISVTDIESISLDISCDAQSAVVQGLGQVFHQLSEHQLTAIHSRISTYLTDANKNQGSTCDSDLDSGAWLTKNCGQFSELFTVAEIQKFNVNFTVIDALPQLGGSQKADYVVSSGALQSVEIITTVLESVVTTTEIKTFFEELNSAVGEEIRSSPAAEILVERSFQVISTEIEQFTQVEYQYFFQESFQYILHKVTAAELEIFTFPLPCASYQQVVKGFDNVFEYMSNSSKEAVYEHFIKPQFEAVSSGSGIKCGDVTQRTQEWIDINIGQFIIYVSYTYILEWNTQFSATEVISTLGEQQLAEVILQVSNLNNEELACQVVGRLETSNVDGLYTFMDQFSASFVKLGITQLPNEVISYKFLSLFVTSIEGALFTYSDSEWETLFSVRLHPVLISIDAGLLDKLLGQAKCSSYETIVKNLNAIHDQLSPATRESLYGSLYGFLLAQHNNKGSACPASDGSRETGNAMCLRLFGKYSIFASLEELSTINPTFNALEAADSFSTEQLASLALSGDVLSNADSAAILQSHLKGLSFGQIDNFLTSFQSVAQTKGIVSLPNASIRRSLFDGIYGIISAQFNSFTQAQWEDVWTTKLYLFLGGIGESQINLIPSNINCEAFQTIVQALSPVYSELSNNTQEAFYSKSKTFLLAQKQGTGSACGLKTSGSIAWYQANLGPYGALASYEDIIELKPDFSFTDAASILNEHQLAGYVVSGEVLRDKDKVAIVLNAVTSKLDVLVFLDDFNQAAAQKGLVQLPSATVRSFFLGEIFCKLGSHFVSFSASSFSDLFKNKLQLFSSALDAKTLGFIPTDISCDSLAGIVESLDSVANPENPGQIYNFFKSVLQTQYANTKSACSSGLSDSVWLQRYMGKYSAQASWLDFISFNPTFQGGQQVAGDLTATQLSSFVSTISIISNVTAISDVLFSISDSDFFFSFLGGIRTLAIQDPNFFGNLKVRDSILMRTADLIFPQLGTISLAQVQNWFTQISFLLPSVNATILEQIPLDISCATFSTIVQALDKIYTGLPSSKRQIIYQFAIKYLRSQTNNGESCIPASGDTFDWVNLYIARYCRQANINDITAVYSDVDTIDWVSLEADSLDLLLRLFPWIHPFVFLPLDKTTPIDITYNFRTAIDSPENIILPLPTHTTVTQPRFLGRGFFGGVFPSFKA
ncbi:uncharacterized protein RCH25_036064 [Pelodytes ibericus]